MVQGLYLLSAVGRAVAPEALKVRAQKISDGFGRKLSVYVSTIVTWFLTGLWHGAAWNFVVWGLLNAFFILLAEEFKPVSQRFRAKHERLVSGFGYRVFETLRTFLLMCSLRVLDCYRDVEVSFRALGTVLRTLTGARHSPVRFCSWGLRAQTI